MGYNYSREFLADNKPALDRLKTLARTGEVLVLGPYETYQEMQRIRIKIQNLLASVRLYEPQFSDWTTAVRTQVKMVNELWMLHVGRPTQPIRGCPPGRGVDLPDATPRTKDIVVLSPDDPSRISIADIYTDTLIDIFKLGTKIEDLTKVTYLREVTFTGVHIKYDNLETALENYHNELGWRFYPEPPGGVIRRLRMVRDLPTQEGA